MKASDHAFLWILVLTVALLIPRSAPGLITGGEGNEPVENFSWPTGSEAVANLETRVATWEGPPFGGGETHFDFRAGSTADFNAALAAFAGIATPTRELILRNGPAESFWLSLRDDAALESARIDWTFVVWSPASWNQLFNNPRSTFGAEQPGFRQAVPPPRIIAYFGDGKLTWDEVKVPAGITVIDQRGQPGEGPSISGGVYDMDTGSAIEDASVSAVRSKGGKLETVVTTRTDAAGRFVLKGFPAGTYVAVASYKGYASKRGLQYEEFRGSDIRELDFNLARTAALEGTVIDPTGKPVAGARVIAGDVLGKDGFGYPSAEGREVKTGASGRFSIPGLPTGYAKLTVWADGWFAPGGVTTLYDVPATEPLVVRMIGTGSVRGIFKATEGRQAMVSISPVGGEKTGSWGGSTTCKPDGTFEFTGVPAGEYLVGPSRGVDLVAGKADVRKVSVKAGEVVTVVIEEIE